MDILKEISLISSKNPSRVDMSRRLLKLQEELGELSQAYLSYSSENNPRGKTLDDLIEEACDVGIVAMDVAMILAGGDQKSVEAEIKVKLQKWESKLKQKKNV